MFATATEAAAFRVLCDKELHDKINFLENGVDTEYFDPEADLDAFSIADKAVVFTGDMGYWANVDAVRWFAKEVWPRVLAAEPNARFYIVGRNPPAQVQKLSKHIRITVSGSVPDVRPYLRNARVVVAPLQIARGVQNKVLEALAMAKPVVASLKAMEGIDRPQKGLAISISDAKDEFATYVVDALRNTPDSLMNRDYVLENYAWKAKLARLGKYLDA